MVFKCKKGKKIFRFKKGTDIRLGGCKLSSGEFIVKEAKRKRPKRKEKVPSYLMP